MRTYGNIAPVSTAAGANSNTEGEVVGRTVFLLVLAPWSGTLVVLSTRRIAFPAGLMYASWSVVAVGWSTHHTLPDAQTHISNSPTRRSYTAAAY